MQAEHPRNADVQAAQARYFDEVLIPHAETLAAPNGEKPDPNAPRNRRERRAAAAIARRRRRA